MAHVIRELENLTRVFTALAPQDIRDKKKGLPNMDGCLAVAEWHSNELANVRDTMHRDLHHILMLLSMCEEVQLVSKHFQARHSTSFQVGTLDVPSFPLALSDVLLPSAWSPIHQLRYLVNVQSQAADLSIVTSTSTSSSSPNSPASSRSMASSVESQSVDIYIIDASQTQHLPAIIAAAGSKKVNIYFSAASNPPKAEAVEDSAAARHDAILQPEAIDGDTEIPSMARIGFSDMPLEIQINVFKLIFVHDTPQPFRVGSELYGEPARTRARVVHFPDVNIKLLRVSKVWEQYGRNMIFENTFSILTSCTTKWAAHSNLDQHARRFFMSIKHLAVPVYYLNLSQLRKLKRFESLQTVHLALRDYSYETTVPGRSGNCKDPILASKRQLMIYLPSAYNHKYRVLLTEALRTIRYMYTSKYQCIRELADDTTEVSCLAIPACNVHY